MMTILVTLLAIAISVYFISLLTEGFFIESLDELSKRLRLPNDVAGATLMAIGSSAPELAIAMIALIIPGDHADVGIGAIVGSALFNVLVITGAAAMVRPLKVALPIITRDTIFYTLSLGLLLWVFWDGAITPWEAGLFLLCYALYIGMLYVWSRRVSSPAPVFTFEESVNLDSSDHNSALRMISSQIKRILGTLMGDPRRSYLRTFIISIALIAVLSWVLVASGIAFAEAVNIPPLVVALTIIAGGTSAPDMISSIVVARKNRGNMAVANALGSNIFDILVGLGLPWIIIMIAGKSTIGIDTAGLMFSIFLLVGSVTLLYTFMLTNLTLTHREGVILVLLWFLYVVWVFLNPG